MSRFDQVVPQFMAEHKRELGSVEKQLIKHFERLHRAEVQVDEKQMQQIGESPRSKQRKRKKRRN